MLTVSEKAAAEFKEIMQRENSEAIAIRLYVSGMG